MPSAATPAQAKPSSNAQSISLPQQGKGGRPTVVKLGSMWKLRKSSSRVLAKVTALINRPRAGTTGEREELVEYNRIVDGKPARMLIAANLFVQQFERDYDVKDLAIPTTETPPEKAPASGTLSNVSIKASRDRTPFLQELQSAVLPHLKWFEGVMAEADRLKWNKPPLRVLGIDPGTTNIALAFLDFEHNTELTTKTDHIGLHWEPSKVRYCELICEQWVRMFQPDIIFIEGIAHFNDYGVAEAGKVQYAMERVAMEFGVPIIRVNTQTMRRYIEATGTEHNKSMIRMRVFQKWEKEFPSEDETDAYAIARTGYAMVTGEFDPSSKSKGKSNGKSSKKEQPQKGRRARKKKSSRKARAKST